jgi:predicted RNA-binding protein YlxR (DUF448 family)
MRKVPYRRDIASGESFPKSELLRIARKDGRLVYDRDLSLGGRGYYVKPDNIASLDARALSRATRSRVSEEEAESLKKALLER